MKFVFFCFVFCILVTFSLYCWNKDVLTWELLYKLVHVCIIILPDSFVCLFAILIICFLMKFILTISGLLFYRVLWIPWKRRTLLWSLSLSRPRKKIIIPLRSWGKLNKNVLVSSKTCKGALFIVHCFLKPVTVSMP